MRSQVKKIGILLVVMSIFICGAIAASSDPYIRAHVTYNGQAMSGASVYFNGKFVGTTNSQGWSPQVQVKPGTYGIDANVKKFGACYRGYSNVYAGIGTCSYPEIRLSYRGANC